jgi:FemAB-related protein (PEP-CTERM system-associated)
VIPLKVDAEISKNLVLKQVTGPDAPAWERFVVKNPDATFYHRIEWKHIIEKSFGHKTYYLMAADNGNAVGILPLVYIKSLIFGSIFCSMPYLNFGGVCADNGEVESLLLKEGEKILKEKSGDYLELRHLKQTSSGIPCKHHKVSMTIELNPDPETLWNAFTTKHRTAVRRAAKNGLELKFGKGELLPEFYDVMCRGWKELGTPIYAYSFLKNIVDALGDAVEICLVFHEGKVIAAAFNGLHKDTVEGMWLSLLNEYAKLQAGYVLYWEMIKRACEKGYKQFHLGRSSVESGGEFFKKKWNAVAKPLYWEYILNNGNAVPELNVDNPKYQRAIKIWRKLPQGVTDFIGPHLAKNIP